MRVHSQTTWQKAAMDRNDEGSTVAPIKDEVHLRRSITLPGAVAVGFTNIIGAGIFVSPKGVIAGTGSVGLCLLVWGVCGVLSLIGAMGLAEIGTMMPVSGGLYIYIYEIYGDLPGFLVQWINIVLQQSSSQALCFVVVANYCLKPFFPGSCDVPVILVRLIAFTANGLAAYLNCRSVKIVSKTQVVFTFLNLVSFCVIITIGVIHIVQGSTDNFQNIFSGSHYENLGLAFYAGLYSYAGWYNLNLICEEMEKPSKNLPRAHVISLTMVTCVFLAMNIAYLSVLTPDTILTSNAVAVSFGEKTLGRYAWFISVTVVISTFGSACGTLLTISRMSFAAARKGHQPQLFASIHVKRGTPLPASLLITLLTSVYICVTDVYRLINFVSFAAWVIAGVALAGVIVLRWTKPDVPRPYKVNILLPITFVIACIFLIVMSTLASPIDNAVGLGISLLGVPVYYFFVKRRCKITILSQVWDRFAIFTQKLLLVVPERLPSKDVI